MTKQEELKKQREVVLREIEARCEKRRLIGIQEKHYKQEYFKQLKGLR